MTHDERIASFEFEVSSRTHRGLVRKFNEDSVLTNSELGIWLVADGMGGHNDGNVASSMIADAIRTIDEASAKIDLDESFRQQVQAVNTRLLSISNGDSALLVGSTVVALLINGQTFSCIWAGDSRCYLVRAGDISQVSHDHTEVQELVDQGTISLNEAKSWPRRNVITRAVGADYDLQLETVSGAIEHGDCFVLCSDQEILANVSWSRSNEACERLIDTALERGGKDNVSVVVVQVSRHDKTTVIRR
jgi:serine/threonine protein phosphatase PrpC